VLAAAAKPAINSSVTLRDFTSAALYAQFASAQHVPAAESG
jgi:hypothetical protein